MDYSVSYNTSRPQITNASSMEGEMRERDPRIGIGNRSRDERRKVQSIQTQIPTFMIATAGANMSKFTESFFDEIEKIGKTSI